MLKLALAAILIATTTAAEPSIITGEVVGVSDGDTITVLVDEEPIKVRLDGIDAPEAGQPFGTQAKTALSDAIFAKPVRVTISDTDRWGRSIGVVEVAGPQGRPQNVNLAMVRAGMAWHYVAFSDDQELAQAEQEARQGRRGLWTDPEPTPPWEWRKTH